MSCAASPLTSATSRCNPIVFIDHFCADAIASGKLSSSVASTAGARIILVCTRWECNAMVSQPRSKTEATRAAEYVHMSTEQQRYSTENQAEVIRQYAERRGMSIVRRYTDGGKSGLHLQSPIRPFPRSLLSGRAPWASRGYSSEELVLRLVARHRVACYSASDNR